MAGLKQKRVEVIVIKHYPQMNQQVLLSVYSRNDGHIILQSENAAFINGLVDDVIRPQGTTFLVATHTSIIIAPDKWFDSIKPAIMRRYNCYSSNSKAEPVIVNEPVPTIVPEYSKVSIPLPDGGRKAVFKYTPSKIIPRRRATLTIGFGDQTVTFEASRANLKAFIAGLKDCIKMILHNER